MKLEFVHAPYTKVSVRSYLEFESPEALAAILGAGAAPNVPAYGTLRWANGVLFGVANLAPTDSVTKEYLAGHLIWDHVDFALMPDYRKEIHPADKPMVTINVINLSNHSLYAPFATWVKNNLAGKGSIQQAAKVIP